MADGFSAAVGDNLSRGAAKPLYELLLDNEGTGSRYGDIFFNQCTAEGGTYVLIQNCGTENARFALPASESYATVASGNLRSGSNLSFTVSGNAGARQPVTLLITDGEGTMVHADQRNTDQSGAYSFSVRLSEFETTEYTVSVRTSEGITTESVADGWSDTLSVTTEEARSITLEGGMLTVSLRPRELLLLHLSDTARQGIYRGNIRLGALQDGAYSLVGATAAALYLETPAGPELLRIIRSDTVTLTDTEKRPYILKCFQWDDNMNPREAAAALK